MGDNKPKSSAGESQLAIRKQLSYSEIEQISKAFVASGMFGQDMDKISKGITKIMAGQELGLAPFASMRAVHVIEGNATLSANTMAGMVKSSGRYDYEVKKKDLSGCEIDFFELRNGKRVKVGTETFDIDEAKMAGMFDPECPNAPIEHNLRTITMYKKGGGSWQKENQCNCKNNWKQYPKAMLFARCVSNGVRSYCPDVFSGMLVYTPDELNAQINASGEVIDMDTEGNITNAPAKPAATSKKETEAVDADIDQTPPADSEPVVDINNEGTEDHPDITDPNEPSQEEIEAANPEPEEEVEPLATVDDEFKDTAWTMYEQLPLKASYRMRWLKEVTGVITRNSIKTDEKWRALMDRATAVTIGEEEIDAEHRTDAGEQEKMV
ncbi:MAG: hypothetical protein WC747_04385 [Candidatus Babeliales bacterium]